MCQLVNHTDGEGRRERTQSPAASHATMKVKRDWTVVRSHHRACACVLMAEWRETHTGHVLCQARLCPFAVCRSPPGWICSWRTDPDPVGQLWLQRTDPGRNPASAPYLEKHTHTHARTHTQCILDTQPINMTCWKNTPVLFVCDIHQICGITVMESEKDGGRGWTMLKIHKIQPPWALEGILGRVNWVLVHKTHYLTL